MHARAVCIKFISVEGAKKKTKIIAVKTNVHVVSMHGPWTLERMKSVASTLLYLCSSKDEDPSSLVITTCNDTHAESSDCDGKWAGTYNQLAENSAVRTYHVPRIFLFQPGRSAGDRRGRWSPPLDTTTRHA